MKKPESVEAYYKDRGISTYPNGLFNVFASDGYCKEPMSYSRRDFYKISFLQGSSVLSWHHHEISIDKPALVFFNPHMPFAWKPVSKEQPGFFCVFKSEFLKEHGRQQSLHHSPLFKTAGYPVYFLNKSQQQYVGSIFRTMLLEINSDYIYKYELLRNNLHLIIHEALKMEPSTHLIKHTNASNRLTAQFFDLLERQFPIDTPDRVLPLKTAGDFAKALHVHVNHLNHTVRAVTGKPTSMHISERIIDEAKALLKHTDWTVSQIAWSLGFETPNYFYTFFKKHTGHSPKHSRLKSI
jgi:AraC-type DNA-binding domain-containing proteins